MSKFKDEINKELGYLEFSGDANDIITMHNKSKYVFSAKKAVSLAAAFVLVFTMIFLPISSNNNSGFTIIANAKSASDDSTAGIELNTENFVQLKSDEPNYIFYNFNYILDKKADNTNLTKKYLFHSFNKLLDIEVKGENINSLTYKINNGSLSSYTMTHVDDTNKILIIKNTTAKLNTEISMDYNEQKNTSFRFNPITSTDDFHDYNKRYFAIDSGEIISMETENKTDEQYLVVDKETNSTYNYHKNNIIGYGYKDNNSLATKHEINELKRFIENNDMIGFYNYQNQIFKRIIDNITLEIIVTMNNGEKETKTLEFLYTPNVINELPENTDAIEKGQTLSTGTISARIKK